MEISIDESVQPVVQAYRPVAVALEQLVEDKLNDWIKLGIVEPVASSKWISPLVVVPKGEGEIRLCVDMRRANQAVMRERFVMPTLENLLPKLHNSKFYGKLDIKDAFHQLELTERSRHITTFITRRGLLRFTRLMFGISCALEIFQRTIHMILLGIDGVFNYLDDIIMYAATKENLKEVREKVLARLEKYNVKLNNKKCVMETDKITFLGHTISEKGIQPNESKIQSIRDFRAPSTKEEVQSFLGLVVYIGSKFIVDLATLTEPLRELTKKDTKFEWTERHQTAFENIKKALDNDMILGYYSPKDRTEVFTDASPVGMGALLVQYGMKGQRRVVGIASRALTNVEQRYCQGEKESLAIVWAVERFQHYLIGIDFDMLTDNSAAKILFGINSRPCPRTERWVLRIQGFRMRLVNIPGKMNIADALSRLCQSMLATEGSDLVEKETILQIVKLARPVALSAEELEKASAEDEELGLIRTALRGGLWIPELKRYELLRNELWIVDDLVLRGTRIVIPKPLRQQVLQLAHEGHPGMSAMKARLRTKVWWSGMDKECEQMVKECVGCIRVGPLNPPEEMIRRKLPEKPWKDIAVDFMGPIQSGEYLLVLVDYFSRYMEVVIMKSITTEKTIQEMETIFARFGYPETVTADNGPQFKSEEFGKFCKDNAIQLNLSIPYWPQANGEVERQNRSILKRLKIAAVEQRNWKGSLQEFLLMYRSTPHSVTGQSPSQLMFGWSLRDKLPQIAQKGMGRSNEELRDKDQFSKEKGREYADKRRRAADSGISVGDTVLAKLMFKESKLTPTFGNQEFEVLKRNLNDVTIRDKITRKVYRRSAGHLKKLPDKSFTDNSASRTPTSTETTEQQTPAIGEDTRVEGRCTRSKRLETQVGKDQSAKGKVQK